MGSTDLISMRENNSTVNAFISYVDANRNLPFTHMYISNALTKLTDATNAMSDAVGYSVKADLDKSKEYANKITNDPSETSHADNIRKSADIIAGALQNLQQAKYPGLANKVLEVKNAAAAINPETLTLDQRDVVKSFFAKAATLLEKMN